MAGVAEANIVRRDLVGEIWRFLTIGTINAGVDFLVYISLTRGFVFMSEHYLLANSFAFVVANLNSFYWNRRWTFNVSHGNPYAQYVQFFGVSIIYLSFIQFGLWLLVSRWGLYDLLAKVIVIGVGMLVYFTVLKRLVFWRKPKPEPLV